MKNKNKKGFALVYAVLLMILVASVGMHTLHLINNTTSAAIKEHIKVQMDLYMNSSIEYALLYLGEAKLTGSKTITIKYPGNYEYKVTMTPLNVPIDIPESQGIVLMDLKGEYLDNNHKFTLAKRTIQKP
jgi:hypothetical protein